MNVSLEIGELVVSGVSLTAGELRAFEASLAATLREQFLQAGPGTFAGGSVERLSLPSLSCSWPRGALAHPQSLGSAVASHLSLGLRGTSEISSAGPPAAGGGG